MSNKTEINASVINENSNITTVNKSISNSDNSTVINSGIHNSNVTIGSILCDKYVIKEHMKIQSGEADLYLCESDNKSYVAKVYRRNLAIKHEVVDKLKEISSPYIATICDMGEWNGLPVEVTPYYPLGSLQGKKFDYEQLKKYIIPFLNEGLKAIHDQGIIHKDLKPSNIMMTEGGKSIAIIDFGISSAVENGSTVIVTRTGMTPQYSAPESLKGVFLKESDYYSMGITIYELFCGKTPYDNMSQDEIEKYITIQSLPFPEEMQQELKDLIIALTYNDIQNRKNKKNPNRRWGYEEVKKWCLGIKQTIPGEGVARNEIPDYLFNGKKYSKREELVQALIENWDEGKKQLFRGLLSQYYGMFDSGAFEICRKAELTASHQSGKDDLIFWSTMYALIPNTSVFFWKGRIYQNLPALGRDMLEHLWKNNKSIDVFISDLLNNSVISEYIKLFEAKNTKMIRAVEGLESSFRVNKSNREKLVIMYMTGYMLSGQKILKMGDLNFRTLGELNEYMKNMADNSFEDFQTFCHGLVDYEGNLDCQFESWLITLGKTKEIERWKQKMK